MPYKKNIETIEQTQTVRPGQRKTSELPHHGAAADVLFPREAAAQRLDCCSAVDVDGSIRKRMPSD
jgi:hypothetical protein